MARASDIIKIDVYGNITSIGNYQCNDLELDTNGNIYFKANSLNYVSKIYTDGHVQAGSDITSGTWFYQLKVDSSGMIYIVDSTNKAVQKLPPITTTIITTSNYFFTPSYHHQYNK